MKANWLKKTKKVLMHYDLIILSEKATRQYTVVDKSEVEGLLLKGWRISHPQEV